MNTRWDIIVIGAGASGLAAAIAAAERGKRVLTLEKGPRPGRKILASGNGRCNLMNVSAPRYYGDDAFAEQVLQRCGVPELKSFFHRYGLRLTEETEGRVYPMTLQAVSVLDALKRGLVLNGVEVRCNLSVNRVKPLPPAQGGGFLVSCEGAEEWASRVILSCGGAAQPKLGGSADGYGLLVSLGHRVVHPRPALMPIWTEKREISGLSGLRVRCGVSLLRGDSLIHQESGELLFTDYGVSGICVMQCARFASKGDTLEVDLLSRADDLPDSPEEEMKTRRERFYGLSPETLLEGILSQKLAYGVLKQAGIPLRGETAGEVSDEQLQKILYTAAHYRLRVTDTGNLDQAQVTAGGADCREFDPETMVSRLHPGLYATGELLNVDGDCGGFNLMFAFASGLIAGQAASQE